MKTTCFGEIMLRLCPPNSQKFEQAHSFDAMYGGSEANVAVSLARFGIPSAFITRIPDNELGHAALGTLAAYGVETRQSLLGGERLGLYFLESGAGLRGSKILYDRQYSSMSTLAPGMIDWESVLAGVSWFHWSGITPALSQDTANATLEALEIATALKIRISCDLNYREKLWRYGKSPADIMPPLMDLTDVVLGDQTAFDLYFGIHKTIDDETLLKNIGERFPRLQQIAMTSRGSHSASHNSYQGILLDGTKLYESRKYELPDMLDRIGGGDAFMAGLIFGLQKHRKDLQETIEFAAAAAALKHYVRGDFNLSTEKEVRALISGNKGGLVNR